MVKTTAPPPATRSEDWSFRYEGPPGGVRTAMSAHAEKNPSRAVPEAVGALVLSEIERAASRARSVVVSLRGDDGLPENTLRNLEIQISFRE